MNRKTFLKQLVSGGTGVAIAGQGLAKGILPGGTKIYHNYLRGLYYYDFEKVAAQLKEGQALQLRREPQNPYDKYAIEVCFGAYKLGYLPRAENKVMANLMDSGIAMQAIVKDLNKDPDELYNGVFVEVYLNI